MKRYAMILSIIVLMSLSYTGKGHCLDVDLRGQVSSLFTLRDTNGFQYGFMDNLYGIQWRNELQVDLTLKPVYTGVPDVYLKKVFLSYRGAYDAIFDTRSDAYENIQKHKSDDFELGQRDIETENDLREAFVDLVAKVGMQQLNLRLGRQIVRWGEANFFNVTNVPNPNDNSHQMFFADPDDLATPLWMGRLDYTVVSVGFFDSLGIELLAIPDIRPMLTAPLNGNNGYANFDAPYAFLYSGYGDPLAAYGLPFDTRVTHINEDVPGSGFENMEYAASLSFGIQDVQAALHYFVGYQDQGAIDWTDYNTYFAPVFLGLGLPGAFGGSKDLTFTHPRQRVYGLSFNYFNSFLNAVIRGEGALTDKVALFDTSTSAGASFISKRKGYQALLGFDKDLHPKWIGTTSALTMNVEGYWKHIDDWKTDATLHPANKEDTYIATIMLLTDYYHGTIKPTISAMYDTEGTWMTNVNLTYDPDGKWLFSLTEMSFWGPKNAISDFSAGGALIETSELSFKVSYRF